MKSIDSSYKGEELVDERCGELWRYRGSRVVQLSMEPCQPLTFLLLLSYLLLIISSCRPGIIFLVALETRAVRDVGTATTQALH